MIGKPSGALPAIAAAAFSVAACDPAPQPKPAEPPPLTPAMGAGLYAIGDGISVYSRSQLAGDGTYTDLDEAGEAIGSGVWESEDDITCFDPKGDGMNEERRCWKSGVANADGSFMTQRVGGMEHYLVTPLSDK